jgi:hypothetical protein
MLMEGFKLTPHIRMGGSTTVEIIEIDPTLQPSDGPKRLELVSVQPKAFLTAPITEGPHAGRRNDWASFAPSEPIRKLSISVEFESLSVKDVTCAALRGRTKEEIPSESAEVNMRLERKTRATHRVYEVNIDYPIVGVSYRIEWKLA